MLCSESDEVRGRCLLISKLINGLIQLHLHLNGEKRLFDSWLKKQGAVLIIVRPIHCSAFAITSSRGTKQCVKSVPDNDNEKQLA